MYLNYCVSSKVLNFNFHFIVLQWFVLLVEYVTLTQRLVKIVLKVVTVVIVWTCVRRVETQACTELMLLDLPVLMTASVSKTCNGIKLCVIPPALKSLLLWLFLMKLRRGCTGIIIVCPSVCVHATAPKPLS